MYTIAVFALVVALDIFQHFYSDFEFNTLTYIALGMASLVAIYRDVAIVDAINKVGK